MAVAAGVMLAADVGIVRAADVGKPIGVTVDVALAVQVVWRPDVAVDAKGDNGFVVVGEFDGIAFILDCIASDASSEIATAPLLSVVTAFGGSSILTLRAPRLAVPLYAAQRPAISSQVPRWAVPLCTRRCARPCPRRRCAWPYMR